MVLSSNGESPNDRLDTLLSLMTGMNERVDKIVKKVSTIESDVSSTKSKVTTIESEVAKVKKRVRWTFVGMGFYEPRDDYYDAGYGHTLAGCFDICTNMRSTEFDFEWNGVYFLPSQGYCFCMKNDGGHDSEINKEWMHFKG